MAPVISPPASTADLLVIGMGGNSLIDPKLGSSVEAQFAITARAVVPIADLLDRGLPLVITHGNGPQVGFMALRSALSREHVHEVPLDSLVADSQGSIGYMIQRALREELRQRGVEHEIVSIVTEVECEPGDAAFGHPAKPIGRFYTEDEAHRLEAERGWAMAEDSHRGWRRVVPSPEPVAIVQLATIRRLVESGVTVVAAGGGGIPVTRDAEGHIRGLEAVIDKDRASALLGLQLGARRLFLTTGVDAVYLDYATPRARALAEVTTTELNRLAAQGQFPEGSMGPKIEAAVHFVENGGDEAVICSPFALGEALEGRAGTRVRGAVREK